MEDIQKNNIKKTDPAENNKKDRKPSVRTLKSDAVDTLQKKGVSLFEITAKAKRKRREVSTEGSNKIPLLTSIIIILLFSIIGIFLYFVLINKNEDINTIKPYTSFVRPESNYIIKIKENERNKLLKEIEFARLNNTQSEDLQLLQVAITSNNEVQNYINSLEFFDITKISPPKDFLNSLEEKWGLYIYNGNKKEADIILTFKTNNPIQAFSGLLVWESHIANDLKPITGVGGLTNKFLDKIIKNNDARILSDGNGSTSYAIFGGNIVIIASTTT